MTNSFLLDFVRLDTLVALIGQLIEDHADFDITGEISFRTEAAQAAYAEALAAGAALIGEEKFGQLLEATFN